MLHRVEPDSGPKKDFSPNAHLSITPKFLDELLFNLRQNGYEFVSLAEAQERIVSKDKGKRFIAITLDDGYIDNLEHAAPIFEKHKAPYTIFIAPGLVDGRATLWWEDLENIIASNRSITVEFPDQISSFNAQTVQEKNDAFNQLLGLLTTEVSEEHQREIMNNLGNFYGYDAEVHRASSILDWKRLKKLAATELCSIGGHTLHHYAVARLRKDQCRTEILQSAKELELALGERPIHFAYPYGYPAAAGSRDFEITKESGYELAVTTRHGVCMRRHENHMHALPRISVNGNFQKVSYVRTLLSGGPTILQNKGRFINVS